MSERLLKILFPTDQHHVEGLHAIVSRLLPANGRMLDLGCGPNAEFMRYRTSSREVWGADFTAHPEMRDAEWFRPLGPGGSIPFDDGSFDMVVTVMVMEHIADPAHFIREVARVLRPGGHFVGHTISGNHYVTWVRRAVGVLPHGFNQWLVRKLYGRSEADTFPAHYRLNRRSQLARACVEASLSAPEIVRYADPGYFKFLGPLQELFIAADRVLELAAPGMGRLYLTATARKNG